MVIKNYNFSYEYLCEIEDIFENTSTCQWETQMGLISRKKGGLYYPFNHIFIKDKKYINQQVILQKIPFKIKITFAGFLDPAASVTKSWAFYFLKIFIFFGEQSSGDDSTILLGLYRMYSTLYILAADNLNSPRALLYIAMAK